MTLPLEGLRVLDLCQVWAGPLATRQFADMGAEVIRVESCQRVDILRVNTPADNEAGQRPWERGWGMWLSRNKYGITLDLTRPAGVDVFKSMVRVADVVVENFSPRVMENFGLQYPVIRELKPDIIMLSLSAYGQTGPYRDYIGYGATLEPIAGLSELAGYPDGPPSKLQSTISDPSGGFHGAGAVLAALHYRNRTGKGQYIDLAETETAMTHIAGQILDYSMNRRVQSREGNRHSWMAPHGCYGCKGEDEWLAIAVGSEDEWRRLCAAIGNDSLAGDPRFAGMKNRSQNQDELDALIEQWTRLHDHREAMHILQKAGVPAAAVLTVKEVFFDEHLKQRKFFEMVDRLETGRRPMPSVGFRMSETPGSIRKAAPLLGQDNDYFLGNLLGIARDRLRHLSEEGVIGVAPNPVPKLEIVPNSVWQARNAIAGVDEDYLERLHRWFDEA